MSCVSNMKTFISVILGCAAIVAGSWGCASGDRFLRTDADVMEISAEDQSDHAVVIEASSSWIANVSEETPWLYVHYAEDNPGLLWVAASVNENPEPRNAAITIVSGDGLTLEIPVVQLGMVIRFEVTPRTLEPFAARDASTQTLTVDTGLSWRFSQLHGDWIVMTRGTEEGSENTLTIGVKPTRIFEERRDTIVLQPDRAEYHASGDSIVVVQAGIDLVVTGDAMDEETFEIGVPAQGGEVSLSVFARHAWEVTTDAPAERVSFDITGHEGGTMENGTPIVMTVAPNTSTEEDYTFVLTFESAGETYEYRCTQLKSVPPEQEPEPETEPDREEEI